jgi:hypothetical protein
MLKFLSSVAIGAIIGVVLRFLLLQFLVVNVHFFFTPIVKTFWGHVLHDGPPSPLDCPDCKQPLYNLPN